MQYREFGNSGKMISALGFGAMRLPTNSDDSADIDQPQTTAMIRRAIDEGVNYIDTAYPYHGGKGEGAVGEALTDGYRDKVSLATKLPIWYVKEAADMDRLFEEQLARLQTDHIDFYLIHCLQAHTWPTIRDFGVCEWGEKLKSEGRIGQFGFSIHAGYETFVSILDYHPWDFCQIQYNYANETVQVGTRGLDYANEQRVPVVVMEPLLGGGLANPPADARDLLDEAGRDPVDLALNWLWDKSGIFTVLSGMSTLEQVDRNLEFASHSGIGTLSDDDRALVVKLQEIFERTSPIPCTKCGYCMPCPQGIDIPVVFEQYNDDQLFHGTTSRTLYTMSKTTAEACAECGQCEEKCPQSISIMEQLKLVDEELRGKKE